MNEASAEAGELLLAAVAAALPDLEALLAHGERLGEEATALVAQTVALARSRLGAKSLAVVVVGEQKSGKSTFLNAVLGERVLGTAARECTATVTRLLHGPVRDYTAQFADGHTERFGERDPDLAPLLEAARAVLNQTQAALATALEPLADMPPAQPGEPEIPPASYDAVAEAERALAVARVERGVAIATLPSAQSWWRRLWSFFAWRRALGQVARAEARHAEAHATLRQTQRRALGGRLTAIEEALAAHERARPERFRACVRDLTDLAGRGGEVLTLTIEHPSPLLPRGLVLVDTPGLNTGTALHQERAWNEIRLHGDGLWLVSDLQQALSHSTRYVLEQARPFVAHVLLVLAKVDRALANAEAVGDGDAREQVEEARKLGVKRFARELGRAPREVFAVAVAAERALAEPASVWATDFATSVETLFALAQQERALVLGARAAGALRGAAAGIARAGLAAREGYEERIALLEAQRIPQPREFIAERLVGVRPFLNERLRVAVATASLEASKALARQQMAWHMALATRVDEDALRQEAKRIGEVEAARLAEILDDALAALRAEGRTLLATLEAPAFEALRARYRVAQALVGAGPGLVPAEVAWPELALTPTHGLDEVLANFDADRIGLGLSGLAAGAALGSLVLPGIGTVVGALVGSLAAFFVSVDDVRQDCLQHLEARGRAAEPVLLASIADAGVALEARLADWLERGLTEALSTFSSWIEERLEAEREAIALQQAQLADLNQREAALAAHLARIDALMLAAEEVSRGLARSPDGGDYATLKLDLKKRRGA